MEGTLNPKLNTFVQARVSTILRDMQAQLPGVPIELFAKDAITFGDDGEPTAVFGQPIKEFLAKESQNILARLGLDADEAADLRKELRDRLNGTLKTTLGDKLDPYDFNTNGKHSLGEMLMAYFLEMGTPPVGQNLGQLPSAPPEPGYVQRPGWPPPFTPPPAGYVAAMPAGDAPGANAHRPGWPPSFRPPPPGYVPSMPAGALIGGSVNFAQLDAALDLPKTVTTTQGDVPIQAIVPHLNRAMAEAGITNPREQAAFIGQLAMESAGFKTFIEYASGAAYEGRASLGNTQPGDGRRFKGRGPIQLTGRYNYAAAGKALGIPLESNPELAGTLEHGFRVAAWYWQQRNIGEQFHQYEQNNPGNQYAGVDRATKLINGGTNGLSARRRYFDAMLAVFAGPGQYLA